MTVIDIVTTIVLEAGEIVAAFGLGGAELGLGIALGSMGMEGARAGAARAGVGEG